MRSLQKLGTFAQGSQSLSEIGQLLRPLPPTLKKVCFGLFHRMQTGCMESLTPLIALSLLWSHGAFTGLDLSCLGLDSPVKISFLASGIHRVVILSLIKNVNDFSNNITLEQSLNPHCFQIKQTNKKGKESVIYLYMNVESLILTFRFKGQHFWDFTHSRKVDMCWVVGEEELRWCKQYRILSFGFWSENSKYTGRFCHFGEINILFLGSWHRIMLKKLRHLIPIKEVLFGVYQRILPNISRILSHSQHRRLSPISWWPIPPVPNRQFIECIWPGNKYIIHSGNHQQRSHFFGLFLGLTLQLVILKAMWQVLQGANASC